MSTQHPKSGGEAAEVKHIGSDKKTGANASNEISPRVKKIGGALGTNSATLHDHEPSVDRPICTVVVLLWLRLVERERERNYRNTLGTM